MNNSEVMSGDGAGLHAAAGAGEQSRTLLRYVLTAAFTMGGVLRDIVYVTIDALRGRYDL